MATLRYLELSDTALLIEAAGGLFSEPPAFQLRFQGEALLQSALAVPRQPNYRALPHKATALQYHLSQNHPFVDGNKRFALAAMEYFLGLNGAILLTTDEMLTDVSLKVASHEWDKPQLSKFIEDRTIRRHWHPTKIRALVAERQQAQDLDVVRAFDDMLNDRAPDPLTLRVMDAVLRDPSSSVSEDV